MALSVTLSVCEHRAQRMGQELEPDRQRCRTKQESTAIGRQIRDAFQVKGNCLLERGEHLLEGAALDRDVEVETDRFPIAIATFGVAA